MERPEAKSTQMRIEKLMEILKEQIDLNERLLKLADEKKEVIMKDDIKRLSEMIIDEQDIIKEMIRLEKERAVETAGIGKSEGIKNISDLKEIAGRISQAKRDEMERLSNRLRDVLSSLEKKNSLNQSLMQFSLDYIDLNVNIMTSSKEPTGYSGYSKGKKPQNGGGMGFDSKY